jgi:superfamily II DNA or RNA helicase
MERFIVERDELEIEREWPVISLLFDYSGTCLRSNDRRERFFVSTEMGVSSVVRNRAAEVRLQCLLESLGAVEIDQVPDMVGPYDSPADYLVQATDNVHSFCSFTAYALPQLEALGCKVTIDPSYPFQVVDDDPAWQVFIEPEQGRIDWFGVQLGVDVDGRRFDLLPALLALIDQHAHGETLESMLRLSARRRAIPLAPNRYLTLDPGRFRALLQVVLEIYRGDQVPITRLRLGRTHAASVARLERWTGVEASCLPALDGVLKQGRALLEPLSPGAALNFDGLTVALRPYQKEGVAWLERLRGFGLSGILADDMGLGKTLQTIALLCNERQSGRTQLPSLVVAPTSLVANWAREIARFCPSLSCVVYHGSRRLDVMNKIAHTDVVVTTYPILIRDLPQIGLQKFHYLVLDEAQAIKNQMSQAARAVKTVQAQHRLCLSGTPVENNLDELWSIFDFLMPDLLGPKAAFQRRFRAPIERNADVVRLGALRERVGPFVLRRMKEQVAKELPAKTELVRAVEIDGEQRDLYESIRLAAHADVRKAIQKKGVPASAVTILDALTKLRQVCCDPRLVRLPAADRVDKSAKRRLFFELLSSQLREGRRVLVFSQFAQMLALLSEGLLERGIRHTSLTGKVIDRQRRIDLFQEGKVDVFLISLKAGGTGLNLTRADTVVHYDPWWNAAAQAQATDRAHRIGQTRPVFVHNLIVAGSVEERMLALQRRKQWLSDSLFALEPGASPSRLELAEVEHLFAPLDS